MMGNITDITGNTGTRLLGTTALGAELVTVIWDSRWMLLAIAVCIVADFRYGWGESSKRYNEAIKAGNKTLAAQYKWRTSRAVRRSVNKMVDYLVWIAVGMAIGMAVLPYVGVNYAWGGAAASALAIFCEGKSFVGHFLFLHGVSVRAGSVSAFFRAFAVALAKKKNQDVGEAMEEGFNEAGKEEHHG